MSKPADFVDVFLSLLPDGSLWQPSETEGHLGAITATSATFFTSGRVHVSGASFDDIAPRHGDSILVAGTALNDGLYRILSASGTSATIDGTFVAETSPGTSFTRVVHAGHLMRIIQGVADSHEELAGRIDNIAFFREPLQTEILNDLEKEYGVTGAGMTEAQRRERLHGLAYAPRGTGAASYLEDQLQKAGFPVLVHENSPAVDPGLFHGGGGGELIVNHRPYDPTIADAVRDRRLWGHVFFIGGAATRDAAGRLTAITPVVLTPELYEAFRLVVLKHKPVHSWCIALARPEQYFTFSAGDSIVYDIYQGFSNADQTTGGFFVNEGDFL